MNYFFLVLRFSNHPFFPASFTVLFSLIMLSVDRLAACDCVPPGTPAIEFAKSRAVFSGKVLSVTTEADGNNFIKKVRFAVLNTWKGFKGSSVMIITPKDEVACGYNFIRDSIYIVYTFVWHDTIATDICTRTKLASIAEEDLAYLSTLTAIPHSGVTNEPTDVCENYPNPFNAVTNFDISLTGYELITLKIYDVLGKEVVTLLQSRFGPGRFRAQWDAALHPSGIYFVVFRTGKAMQFKKIIVMK
jgi:hypothetical protein